MQKIQLATVLGALGALVGLFSWFKAGANGPGESGASYRCFYDEYAERGDALFFDAADPVDPPAGEDLPPVSFGARVGHSVLEAGGFSQEVFLWIGLRAAEVPEAPRPDMNLALVIDRSGSMGSEDKLHHAKAAAEQLVQRLRPSDHLAIVCYDDTIETLVQEQVASAA